MLHVVEGWEKTSPILTGELVDEADNPLTTAEVSSVLFTLYNLDETGSPVINTRNGVQVLVGATSTTGEFSIDAQGIFRMKLAVNDMPIVVASRSVERHVAQFLFTWLDNQSVSRTGLLIVHINVKNAEKVT